MARWLVRGGENFYLFGNWKLFLQDAVTKLSMSTMNRNTEILGLYMGRWSTLVQKLRKISRAHMPVDDESRAPQVLQQALSLADELDEFHQAVMDQCPCAFPVVPDPSTPIGVKYDFDDYYAFKFTAIHAHLRIVLNRVITTLNVILYDQVPDHMDYEHYSLCEKVWMCLPYVRATSLMEAILFADSFYTAYEAATGAVREYLLTWLMEVASFRKRMSNDREAVDKILRASALAYSGRSEYREKAELPFSR